MTTREVKPGALAQLRAPVVALGRREPLIQFVIDVGAIMFAAFFTVLLIAAAITAPLALLLLFLMFV